MKAIIFIISIFTYLNISAQNVQIIESKGWNESASVKWKMDQPADSFKVYYSGNGLLNIPIDPQLVRKYENYFRADIPGLKSGKYQITVVPVISNQDGTAVISEEVTVSSHDRSGFAFKNGRIPGAYNADGTPKSGAVVLYITENTKNTISLDVTGANANPCVGLETILEGFKKGKDNRPLIIRMIGQVTDPSYLDKGDIVIENSNNASGYITLEGIGEDAVADGWGIRVKNASNIEIRNIATMNCNSDEGDNIGLQQNNDYIWVHHCDFFYGDAGSDSDQAKGDGALDCKKSTYVTFSYNHFWDTGKSNLLGLSEGTTSGYYITYHHNWFDHSDSRHPRVRYYTAHVYNNYYDGNSKYGVGSTLGSSVFVEGNYFRNCKYPILTSMQGSDVYDENTSSNDYTDMPTFSKEDGGSIKAFNNTMIGERRFVAYGDTKFPNSSVDFDAFVATSKDQQMGSNIKSVYGTNTYNNFDTNASIFYSYVAQSPEDAMQTVINTAGRINGGDFKWTFNNAIDDASYDVNQPLKSALVNYKSHLLAIQGDGNGIGSVDTTSTGGSGGNGGTGGSDTTSTGEVIKGDIIHNFTESGKSSSFFSISGNLSDSKGTVSYDGLTLTQCLKIESSTSISFTTNNESTLTLVFNEGFSGKIKVDGTDKIISNGILSETISASSHQITKTDVANLYFMSIKYQDDEQNPDDSTNVTEPKDTTGLVLNNHLESVNLLIYPNPASDVLHFQSSIDITTIEIYNMSGQLLKSINEPYGLIDVSELESGLVMVKMNYKNGFVLKRILIKNK